MRLWMVKPSILCRKHLLGEHLESHMFVGAITKGKSITGFIEKGLVEVHNIVSRHDELAEEMLTRGYRHQSPLTLSLPLHTQIGEVDSDNSMKELASRCPDCRERIERRMNHGN